MCRVSTFEYLEQLKIKRKTRADFEYLPKKSLVSHVRFILSSTEFINSPIKFD